MIVSMISAYATVMLVVMPSSEESLRLTGMARARLGYICADGYLGFMYENEVSHYYMERGIELTIRPCGNGRMH